MYTIRYIFVNMCLELLPLRCRGVRDLKVEKEEIQKMEAGREEGKKGAKLSRREEFMFAGRKHIPPYCKEGKGGRGQ